MSEFNKTVNEIRKMEAANKIRAIKAEIDEKEVSVIDLKTSLQDLRQEMIKVYKENFKDSDYE